VLQVPSFFGYPLSPTFAKKAISHTHPILSNPIEYLKGVGPFRADLLKKELGIFTFGQLLDLFPFRHIDKTSIRTIAEITPQTEYILLAGIVTGIELTGEKRSKRLTAILTDKTGSLELTWFQGINWIQKSLLPGTPYLVYGKPGFFMGKPQLTHPELEPFQPQSAETRNFLEPVYPSTEKLKARGLSGRSIGKLTYNLFGILTEKEIPENLPVPICNRFNFPSRWEAYRNIHFPADPEAYEAALHRLKFEEFFMAQIRLGLIKSSRHRFSKGFVFEKVGSLFNEFYAHHLPFSLTGAQKRVLKEIRKDIGSGRQVMWAVEKQLWL
jgi:ATP-dependent DNA helicase RecG